MSDDFGTLTHSNGYITASMKRDIDVSVEEVWSKLSEESERVKWLAEGSIELFAGGRAQLDFKDSYVIVDSEVTACEAPRLLEFSWSGQDEPKRPIRFELEPNAGGCRIHLTVSIPENEVVARSCAGWEAHLTMLQAAAAGVPIKFPLDRFKACREQFDAEVIRLLMSEVPVLKL
ncbi:MAG: SRPBCC family protein [Proteobacteria bacterium]|jgi:uncharacterized protein YndB with AHSA1/START domain|nr:SRPBCC family protein [Pseudomonadota bacterium]MDA1300412.1 SRPBCC family protein [Pseudomonadota bacterium]